MSIVKTHTTLRNANNKQKEELILMKEREKGELGSSKMKYD